MDKLQELKQKLSETSDFIERMEIQDQIREAEVALGLKEEVKPVDSYFECVGCGS